MNPNNQYQDNQNYVDSNSNNQGYNDTYYNNNYNNNSYNEPVQNEPKNNNMIKIIIIIVLIALLGLAAFFIFGGKGNGEKEYAELTKKLCDAAIEYQRNHQEIIDKDTPGATAYITLQKLSDAYLIDSIIKDPRKKGEIMPLTTYVRLSVASNGEVYCESVVDTGDDKTPPILTLNGEPEVTLLKGTNYTDPGAKAVDDTDGDLTSKITRSGNVDVTKRGDYTITYRVTDTSGNSTSKERKVLVREYNELDPTAAANLDVTPPQIEIKGANPYCLELNKKYVEPGIIAVDNVDGVITNRVIVDNKATGERLGTFRVTYTVEDTAGNKTAAYRSVEVKSSCAAITPPTTPTTPVNSKPTISLNGSSPIIVNLNEEYKDMGAKSWDKEDGDLTRYIRINDSEVNAYVEGTYNVYYEVTDSAGAKTTAKRIVTVVNTNATTNKPIAHFMETPANIKIPVGTTMDIPVPIAKDDNGNLLQVNVVVKGPAGDVIEKVDFYRVGLYTIIYSATPQGGVSQSVSRTVDVYDTTAPILTAPANITITKRDTNCSLTIEDLTKADVRATDSSNSRLARIKIKSGDVDVCKVNTTGTSIQIYAEDDYGNKSDTRTINVKVIATPAPTDVTSVSVLECGANKEINLTVGAKKQLGVAVYPTEATNRNVTWSIDEPNPVVSVVEGLVTANARGSAHVRVKSNNGKEDTCYIIVNDAAQNVSVTGVSIEGCPGGTLSIEKGKGKTLTAAIQPATATNQEVTWTSSDQNKVTINKGAIFGKEVGTSTVTVTTKDGNKTATCVVTVNPLTITDSTPPAKVTVISNNANTADLYNTNGKWFGGPGNNQIKLVVESSDAESGICSFEVVRAGNQVTEVSPIASNPNRAEIVFDKDTNETVQVRAKNCGNVTGELSNMITIRLDKTGPVTSFTQAIQDPNKWLSQATYTTKYQATDAGIDYAANISKYEYAYSDVDVSKLDPTKLEKDGETTIGEATFKEDLIKNNIYVKYIYFRAIDSLGNIGEWTKTPLYLNLDTVAPKAPGINVGTQSGNKVTVSFTFEENTSPKPSGFGSYLYKLNSDTEKPINTQAGTFDIINATASATTNSVTAWTLDKAGNKSTATTKAGINVLPGLTVTCPKSSIATGEKIVCQLSGASANQIDVKLECLNGSYYRTFTTISSDKTIYCRPSNEGKLTVKATKTGWGDGRAEVTVTKSTSGGGTSGGSDGGNNGGGTQPPPTNPTDKCVLGEIKDSWGPAPVIPSTTLCSNITASGVTGTTINNVRTHTYKICIKGANGNVYGNEYTHYITPKLLYPYDGSNSRYRLTWVETLQPETDSGVKNVDRSPDPVTGYCTTPSNKTINLDCGGKTSMKVGESVTCKAQSDVDIFCMGAGYNSQPNMSKGSKTCYPTASGTLSVVAQGTGYNSTSKTITVNPKEVPKANISCSYGGSSFAGKRGYRCTSTIPNATITGTGTLYDNSTAYFYTSGNATGSTGVVKVTAPNYTENSVTICQFPNVGDGCSKEEAMQNNGNGKTVCSGTVATARTCKGVNKKWVNNSTSDVKVDASNCVGKSTSVDTEITKQLPAAANATCEEGKPVYFTYTYDNTCRARNFKLSCDYKWQ